MTNPQPRRRIAAFASVFLAVFVSVASTAALTNVATDGGLAIAVTAANDVPADRPQG